MKAFQLALVGCATLLTWQTYLRIVPGLNTNWIVQSYLALIPLYLLGQSLSIVLEMFFFLTGWHYPAHFQFPPLAKNLTEFWGRRWASWVADWLNQMVFRRYRNQPLRGLFFAFFYSGIWHELLINVPLYLFYDLNVLGSQLIYFMIQAAGIAADRKMRQTSALRRIYLWGLVVIPAPLVINEAVLRFTGLLF